MAPNKIDSDEFDELCDHLVVIDKSKSDDFVVGTYRLLFKIMKHWTLNFIANLNLILKIYLIRMLLYSRQADLALEKNLGMEEL